MAVQYIQEYPLLFKKERIMLEPSAIVLYADNLAISSQFYQDLLGITPEEASPTFHTFALSNGMSLGLKAKHTVEPPADEHRGSRGELAFTVSQNQKVDELFTIWQKKEICITQPPMTVTYGYTFLALDPDGNRLRVVSVGTA